MGSQTLEILRQGIWASLTGGWFYDPHQNLFCNTVHLYIWLFLLCLPFSIYLYFPPASLGWIIYCSLVAAVFTCLKLINHGLHHMYDTSECIIVHQPAKGQNNESQREEGMEMQMLRLGVAALNTSDNESITSLEYHKPNASTIDLKVDVHRKNSSESSLDNAAAVVKSQDNATAITKSDLCVAQSLEATGSSEIRRTRPRSSHKRDHRTKTRKYCVSKGHELNLENNRLSKNDDSLVVNLDEGPFAKVSRHYSESHNISPNNKDFIKEWLYLDGKEAVADETYQAKYSRQLSIDSRDSSEQNVGPPSPKKRMSQRRRYNNYADESYSKSAMALVTSQSSNMRRNSNSTMSTIQLPLLNSTAQLVSQMRRHSNNADSDFFASVELGKYMMEKSEPPGAEKGKTSKDKTSGVRRIKSAALEIGCPPPSVSNLSPHPNSAETIGGQILKNPKSAVIPPPSKCLTRGPHLNLCPKNESGEGSSYPYLNYGSEIVYPIAEISDEMQTSQKETDIDSSEDSYSEYEEENINMKLQFRGFDWEADQSPEARSSDSDFENNGSRSPLLDRTSDVKVVKNRTVGDNSKKNICIRHSNIKQIEFNNDRSKVMPNIKLTKDHVKNLKTESNNLKNHAVQKQLSKNITKCENDTIDHFDKNSVISKDFLIKKHSVELNETSNLHKIDKKSWEQDQSSYGTSSIESNDNIVFKNKTENEKAELDDEKLEVRSVYSINWLFEDLQKNDIHEDLSVFDVPNSNTNFRKNLGAIPKQNRNVSRSRGSSQKENKIKENKKDKDQNSKEEIIDTVEAQAALVQGLECLFAATNASTVVMPNHNPEDRPRSSRQQSIRLEREPSTKARKRSIEEVAQSSTNALLPTSMPLLAAFLHSRVDFPHVQVSLPTYPQAPSEAYQNIEDNRRRSRPLMERNHRNRMRKLKRSSKQKMTQETSTKRPQGDNPNNNITHLATSFDDTSEGAVHCFRDEYGNWVSYTFDPNNPSKSEGHSVISKVESSTHSRKKSLETAESLDTAGDVSCGSLDSEVGNSDKITKSKRGESLDQSSSNQGSNNPLLANSYNNLSTVVPINTNASNKRLSVFDGGTSSLEPRSPVAFVTDSLLEQIEAERQSRMGLPSMHINFLLSQQRAQQQAHNSDNANNMQGAILMPSIGEENLEINLRSKFSKLMGDMEKSNQPKPKSYYKFRFFKNWEVKVSMDRLKLMALFDRNLTFSETFISIFLAIIVAILGSFVLNLGLYRDIYAFWFCFIIAGSQYSLLKSVQPDSASPVHGFNKMVVFSRPVYFCLCSAILCGANRYLEEFSDSDSRSKINASPINVYGMKVNEKEILTVIQNIVATFLLFFPLAFSLGFFPQVNTFLMYLLEQIDMHVFGGNATSSLSAAFYCVFRSMTAIGVLYGFAYSGLVEGKKSQHQKHNIIFSIFCGLLVPISYHLSRSASDYSMMWNLVKKHLLPPELYMSQSTEFQNEEPKEKVGNITEQKKENSESNVSKEHSIGSSASKINFSSETNIAKLKRSQTSSASSLKNDAKCGDSVNSSNFTKTDNEPNDNPPEVANESKLDENIDKIDDDMEDPLPRKLQATVNARLKNDVIVCTFLGLCAFGLHCTTIFTTLRPQLNTVLWMIAGILGWILHYFTPQLRKQQPWLFFAGPALRQHEYTQFEVSEPARLMVFEKIFVYLCFLERNILFPAVVIAATTQDAPTIADKYGDAFGALIICVCALKCLRNCYSDPNSQYLIIVFAFLLFQRDLSTRNISETFLVDYFVMAIIFNKVYEFLLKVQFVVTYIAPWQITWGSAFHAFAQPFSVPHSAMLFLQAAFSALLSSPLTPALGSAIFMTSYVRPVKFWERDYNTKRVDQSNTRLSSHLERNLGSDDNNLNSIFYEHLTRSLQHYLCGDLMLGRWGPVQQGDCFVLASDYLNCLVHIVEMGNGLVSFQLRGLEFRGTYCQQREVEAISEGPEENNDGVCGWWCNGRVLSPGAMFSLRWLAWQLTSSKYVLEGYSVSDNSAVSMLQVFDFRKVLLTYYVKSIIYYTLQSSKLEEWLSSSVLVEALKPVSEKNFADLDPIFNVNLDEDYDFRASGITRSRFCSVYQEWIVHCCQRRGGGWRRKGTSRDSPLVTLCFALSLVGRRALAAAQHLSASSVEFFLYGLHSLFKGDFRITCARDEWVFTDMSLLHSVLSPAIRMALKLHQDHFMFPEEYCSSAALYTAISSHTSRLVICHEAAPAWRYNVLRGAPHLLALRHVMDEGSDDYKIIMLNKRHLGFRVIKLNRECVRGLWAGQQQELIYLRNRNPERGSIQNAKQALRNIINSSCDQPIGYPIYVSPLTTSYADTSEQLCSLVGGAVSVKAIKSKAIALWRRVRRRCGEGCSSGSGTCDVATVEAGTNRNNASTPRHNTLHLSRNSLAGTRGSLASAGKPTSSTLASLAGLLREHSHERAPDVEAANGSTQDGTESRRSEERLSGSSGTKRERNVRVKNKDAMRQGGSRSRMRREHTRHASFRLLGAERLNTDNPDNKQDDDRQLPDPLWDGREQPRRAVSVKVSSNHHASPQNSSSEDLSLSPSGPDACVNERVVPKRSMSVRQEREFKRYYSNEGTSKDLSKPSKEIRHERESYRELTGRYTEKPDVSPINEAGAQAETSKGKSRDSKKDSKQREIKTKIKRIDSGQNVTSVSVGSKVLIVEPLGVYDCINLGRRIDVLWPSEFERERGGRNHWGSWVPMAGMDGLVVHKWTPNHRDPKLRSHVDKNILLVQINERFVPIAENCVQDLGDEV